MTTTEKYIAVHEGIVKLQQENLTLKDRVKELETSLIKIANWELPESGKFWDDENPEQMSYEAAFGSNGARDYIRRIAFAAINKNS